MGTCGLGSIHYVQKVPIVSWKLRFSSLQSRRGVCVRACDGKGAEGQESARAEIHLS
jgi:hypothetical protein